MKILLIISLLIVTLKSSFAQTNYIWAGTHSNNWNDSLNWTPKGIPSVADNINVSGENNSITLNKNVSINSCTVQNTYLDLKSFSFTVNNNSTFTTVQTSAGSLSFSGTINLSQLKTKAALTATCNSVSLKNCVFDSSAYLQRTGNSTGDFWGSNIFNGKATVIQNSTGATWNIGQGDLREQFNNDVAFIAQEGSITIAPVNACLFRGNLTLSSTGQGISIGDTTLNFLIGNSLIASGKAIITTGFSSGKLSLYKIEQEGTNPNTFQLTGNTALSMNRCDYSGNVSISTEGTDTTKVGVSLTNNTFRQSTTITTALVNLEGNNFNASNTGATQIIQKAAVNQNQLRGTNMISGTLITQ